MKPYDILVDYDSNCTKYVGLNSDNTFIADFHFAQQQTNHIYLDVHFPPLDSNKIVYIKFISRDEFTQSYYQIYYQPGDTESNSSFEIPYDKSNISGKIIYLELSRSGYMVSSFDKFGIKDISLNVNSNNEVYFSAEDISYRPDKASLNYNISAAGNSNPTMYNYISFPGMNHNSEILIEAANNSRQGVFSVPVLKEINYRMRILCESGWQNEKWSYGNAGDNVAINIDDRITILSPANNQSGITDTSTFSISDNGEKGVYFYYYRISSYLNNYSTTLVTDKKSFSLKEAASPDFIFGPNSYFVWYAAKISKYNSIDDFASVKYLDDINYNAESATSYCVFKTAP